MAEKEKGDVDDRVTAGLLVQVCLRIRALAKLGVKFLPLDMTCCPLPPLLFQGHPSSPTRSRRRAAAARLVELQHVVFNSFSAGCSARLAAASLSLPLFVFLLPVSLYCLGFGCGRVLERCLSLGAFVSPSFSLID